MGYFPDRDNRMQRKEPAVSGFMLYAIITAVVYILPFLKLKVPYIAAALLMLVSLPVLMLKEKKWWNYGIALMVASGFVFLTNYLLQIFGLTDAINEMLRNIRFFLPAIWGSYALRYSSQKQKKWFLTIFTAMVAVVLIITLVELEKDPWIARVLAQGKESSNAEVNAYRERNVGGFEFSYMMGIVTLCLTWGFLSEQNKIVRLLYIVLIGICFYYIIQTMYTTLLLLTVIGVCALLFIHSKNTWTKVLFVIIALVMVFMLEHIFLWLSQVFPQESLLSVKFEQLYTALSTDDLSAVGSRPERILLAFENWLKSPIFGDRYSNSSAHSMIMSTLEQNGIVGFALWGWIFGLSWKLVRRDLVSRKLDPALFQVAMMFVLILTFFNPIGYVFEVTIAAFFIVPVWISVTGCAAAEIMSGDM